MVSINSWNPEMTDKEAKDLAYWERNVLALKYADGWYNDDVKEGGDDSFTLVHTLKPRFDGWRRVLSLDGGKITFHIPDDFDVGNLPQIARNWDGHTTEEKWRRILSEKGIKTCLANSN